jgi:hypothetical protein
MSYVAHHKDFAPRIATPRIGEDTGPSARPGVWQRLLKAFRNSRRRSADREIARFIQGRGGHLTDELERDLMRHMTASPRYWGLHL